MKNSDEERKKLQAEDSERQKQFENEQRKKYNPDNIFKKRDTKIETVENAVAMIEFKE